MDDILKKVLKKTIKTFFLAPIFFHTSRNLGKLAKKYIIL